jgi:outer membrane protein OmpA-like peptidoglycan-associated protein
MLIDTMLLRFVRAVFLCGLFVFTVATVAAQHIDLENANAYYNSSLFKEAIPLYERVLNRDGSSGQAMVRLADCYRYVNNLEEAANWYAKALKYDENKRAAYAYSHTLKGLKRYDEAKAWAVRYAQSSDSLRGYALAATCDYAKTNIKNTNSPLFSVKNMATLNSKSADFAPIFYKDQLLFASSRSVPVQKGKELTWTNDAFNQYYLVAGAPNNYTAQPLRATIGKDINDAPMAFNKAGDFAAITSNNFMDGIRHISGSGMMMDIYLYDAASSSEWKPGTEQFFSYNAGIDEATPFSTGQPCLNAQSGAMYFASNRAGGLGGYDIYVSYRSARGWSVPKNLGYPVNTPGDEMSPYIDDSGRLFFSSDFHEGFGGLDVFTADPMPWGWANVQNLGNVVNSSYDDMYFIYDHKKQIGYFSSNRKTDDSKGNEDIYMAQQLRAFTSRPRRTIAMGEQNSFYNIQYTDGNELIFTPEEHERMYEIVMALNDNPDVLVQIHAFTDCRGVNSQNLTTSQTRARLIAQYFINNNISKTRISSDGYGEDYPINNCIDGARCSEREHLLNRRIEVTFVGRINDSGVAVLEYDATPDSRKSSRRQPIDSRTRTRPRAVGSNAVFVAATPEIKPNVVSPNPKNTTPTPTPSRPRPETDYTKTKTNPTTNTSSSKKSVRKDHYAIGDQIDIANIYYEHNKATVDEKKSPGLKEILDVLIDQPYVTIEIGAHTDSNGEDNYNQELSRKRAEAVKSYLVKKGIPAARLTTKGYGETKLLNHCKDGVKCDDDEHAKNRRTEFVVIGQKGFKVGDVIQVAAINYERNSLKLDMKNSDGLQEILALLKGNSRINVEIRSHTDSNGTSKYNLDISEKRAKSVYDYLTKNGIPASRLKYKGYGETMLVNKCKDGVKCDDDQHAQNRRVDFKVISVK